MTDKDITVWDHNDIVYLGRGHQREVDEHLYDGDSSQASADPTGSRTATRSVLSDTSDTIGRAEHHLGSVFIIYINSVSTRAPWWRQ